MGASTIKDIKDQRRRSLNETVVGGSRSSSKTVDKLGVGDDCTDSISLASSYKTANSKSVRAPSDQIHGARSEESISSNMDSHSMVTAMSGSFMDFNASGLDSQSTDDEDRAMTPTEASEFFVVSALWLLTIYITWLNDYLTRDIYGTYRTKICRGGAGGRMQSFGPKMKHSEMTLAISDKRWTRCTTLTGRKK